MNLAIRFALSAAAMAVASLAQASTLSVRTQFGEGSGFEARDINTLGQVVGFGTSGIQLWNGSGFSGVASSSDTLEIVGLNNTGTVLYNTANASGALAYSLWNGGMSTPSTASPGTVFNGLNDNGMLVGYSATSQGICGVGFTGAYITSNPCTAGSAVSYLAVNNNGDKVTQVVNTTSMGVTTYLESASGSRTSLGALSSVAGLNVNGGVAGIAGGKAVYVINGKSTDILSSVTGASAAKVFDINDAGQVVGEYTDTQGNVVGFLWDNTGLTNLDSYLQGLNLQRVSGSSIGLNNLGQIVLTTFSDSSQAMSTMVIQTQVPEPGTYALMGLGLLGLSLVARRRR